MSSPACCQECGKPGAYIRVLQGRLCVGCQRRIHYHPAACPGCGQSRPLGYRDDDDHRVCADCAGAEVSVFACADCGREDHPYGARRCARCILRERLIDLFTEPITGNITPALQPVFDAMITSDRPQSTIYWLRRPPGVGPRLLRAMATGQMPISHDAFEGLPSDRAHNYLRDLLAAVGVLPPYEPAIARMTPWLENKLTYLPPDDASVVNRFARWRVLRRLRGRAERGELTKAMVDRGRIEIIEAIRFLAWVREQGATIDTAGQEILDHYLHAHPSRVDTLCTFLGWLPPRTGQTRLELPTRRQPLPMVTVSDEDRWASVELLLHESGIRLSVRICGLFTLLFAQPLTSICRMRAEQVHDDGEHVFVTFDQEPIEMPPELDTLLREQLGRRGNASYASRENGWLFPGGIPGRSLQTENIRAQLVELGIKPYDNRKTTLFQLAATIPAPILADLVGITPSTAIRWGTLTSRSWSAYIAQR